MEGVEGLVGKAEGHNRNSPVGETYVNVAKAVVPPMNATAIAKGEIQKRKLRLMQATRIEVNGSNESTEKELVMKANMALDIMGLQGEGKPDGTRFVGASKEQYMR